MFRELFDAANIAYDVPREGDLAEPDSTDGETPSKRARRSGDAE